MDLGKYKGLFVEESREHLAELSRLLVAVESSSPSPALVDEIFRHAHSIKGMSASMGYEAISTLAHRMEDVVAARREAGTGVAKGAVDVLLAAVDALGAQIDAVADDVPVTPRPDVVEALSREARGGAGGEAPGATPAASGSGDGAPAGSGSAPASALPVAGDSRVVRVRVSPTAQAPAARAFLAHRRLASVATIAEAQPSVAELKRGELPSSELRFVVSGADEAAIRRALGAVADLEVVEVAELVEPGPAAAEATARPPRGAPEAADQPRTGGTVRVRTEVLDGLINSVGELFIARERLSVLLANEARPDVRAALDALSARIREIHDRVMAVRMMPLRTLTDRYPRLVRDLGRSLGKEVELEVRGSEIELDRAILDHLDAVFVHTLRNAIDHGIETAEERVARGKRPAGRITVTAARDRDMVVVMVEDDGRGLDPALLRQVALERGLVSTREAEEMTVRESYFLVCLPGFSTRSVVSDVSGRGVGMDAVRSRIESLGGTLDIESETGARTRFIVRLPLTLAIIPVLLVEAVGTLFAIPIAKVVSVREKGEDVIRQTEGAAYLSFQHALVPIVDLGQLLGMRAEPALAADYVVVIEDGRDLSGLGVARVVGYHEAVVKPLGDPLDRLEWFSGAAILGDGHPILILDLPRALRQRPSAA